MNLPSVITIVLLSLASGAASAGVPNNIPEPGVIELLSIGGVAALVIALRKRRK